MSVVSFRSEQRRSKFFSRGRKRGTGHGTGKISGETNGNQPATGITGAKGRLRRQTKAFGEN